MGKLLERAMVRTAKTAWPLLQGVNKFLGEGKAFQPKWAPAPLLKSYQKVKPPLGFPRETDSLCPKCVKEMREDILSGNKNYRELMNSSAGEIKARIIEEDNKVYMVKTCEKHGSFKDMMANDARFLQRMEELFPGSDLPSPPTVARDHGSSSVRYGRGSVLTIDLTNRCNMMCEPCFMDANQVGYVHELEWQEIKQILDDSVTKIKPKRQLSVQFSGGEPTMSPLFLDAVRYAREVGYFSVQAATNGIRFAEDPEFAKKTYEAGMRIAYLQFDGVGNENHVHRKIGNLFDVKLRAIQNLYDAGIEVVLVVTLVNTVNDHQVGEIIQFTTENSDKISFISFQPVSFTGRDEDISDEERLAKRYTLAHLAHDVQKQAVSDLEPLRDWFPLSAISVFSDFGDLLKGPESDWGTMSCGCHPNCGVGTAFFVDKQTKRRFSLGSFFDIGQFMEDVKTINDAARGAKLSKAQVVSTLIRNYNPKKAPEGFALKDLLQKFDKQSGGTLGGEYGEGHERKKDRWLLMFVAGMWFQDNFNYDFRRTERCIIPYGTQEGEISFCAYNTGKGWRQIVEHVYKTAKVGEWYKTHGRHQVYADGKALALPDFTHTLRVRGEDPTKLIRLPSADGRVHSAQTAKVA